MNYIFELNHPKHYFQFRNVMIMLNEEGHQIKVLARNKDVLLQLLKEEGVNYTLLGNNYNSIFTKLFGSVGIMVQYYFINCHFKANVIISKASLYGCLTARIFGAKSIIFPDSEIVKLTNWLVAPLATKIVTPDNFLLNFGKKHVRVSGFFENSYLSPFVFVPEILNLKQFDIKQPYAIIRFIGWDANHDVGKSGFTLEQKRKLVQLISSKMNVYITSEKVLPPDLERFRLTSPVNSIHQILKFAELYVGDSQTMATEASLLGTPALRSNSFVGSNDMSNFKILEEKYELLFNFSSFDELILKVEEFCLSSKKDEWLSKCYHYHSIHGNQNDQVLEIISSI